MKTQVFCGGGIQGQGVLRGQWGMIVAEDKGISSLSPDPFRLNIQRQML